MRIEDCSRSPTQRQKTTQTTRKEKKKNAVKDCRSLRQKNAAAASVLPTYPLAMSSSFVLWSRARDNHHKGYMTAQYCVVRSLHQGQVAGNKCSALDAAVVPRSGAAVLLSKQENSSQTSSVHSTSFQTVKRLLPGFPPFFPFVHIPHVIP